jgi:NTE family protein
MSSRIGVFGGGGSRGAAFVGFLRAAAPGRYAATHGVSVGALVAARLAQYDTIERGAAQLVADWSTYSTGHVLASWPGGPLDAALKGALWSTEPLRREITRALSQRPMLAECVAYAADLDGGCLARFRVDGTSLPFATDALMASAAMPGAMPAVPINGALFTDGGVVRVLPLAEALLAHEGAEHFEAYLCADPYEPLPPARVEGVLQAAQRMIDLATHERAARDLDDAHRVWCSMQAPPRVTIRWPRERVMQDPMSFDPALIARAIQTARDEALRTNPQREWTQ